MIRLLACALIAAAMAAASSASQGSSPSPDAGALAAVKNYVNALQGPDTVRAFALLTPAQQHYFGNARNFASNYATSGYRIVAFSIVSTTMRTPDLAQIEVAQTVAYYDVGTARTTTTQGVEAYIALRTHGEWGVKEIYQPWKSYAPKASGHGGGLTVIVDRIEFFDHRVQVDCTLRDLGNTPVQALPLLRSTLTIGGATVDAMNEAVFPLNDRQLFEGVRIYPLHQVVGYVNFALPSRADSALTVTLKVSPVVPDGASGPSTVTVGPMQLQKW